MPKLKPDTQRARREHILDAAERCFAAAGFHRSTMQDICRAAAVSPGALYLYFDSKEALIAGIAERDRAQFAERFAPVATAIDVVAALTRLGEAYVVDESPQRRRMCVEIGVEAARNPRVAQSFRSVDTFVRGNFKALFERLEHEGRLVPGVTAEAMADLVMIIGDGLFWRVAVVADFDAKRALPVVTRAIASFIRPGADGTTNNSTGQTP